MTDPLNDRHTTDGERYRTSAHPLIVAALGRAIWNFLSLENHLATIVYEGGLYDLGAARKGTAGEKEGRLVELRDALAARGASDHVVKAVQGAIDAFRLAREESRNALAHATPFTAGYTDEGVYMPGLELKSPSGRRWVRDALELHEIAHRIEDAISPLGNARRAVRRFVALSD